MPNEFPAREMSAMVALFQRAHNKIVSLQRLDDQIATMVVQHQRLQEEVRVVQTEINEEFARALRYNQAPEKLPSGLIEAAGQRAVAATASQENDDHAPRAPESEDDLELIRLPARA